MNMPDAEDREQTCNGYRLWMKDLLADADSDDMVYKERIIQLNSVQEPPHGWMPVAIVATIAAHPGMVPKMLFGSRHCPTQADADAIALMLAQQWIDEQEERRVKDDPAAPEEE
jgi:hypothetical protein